MSYDKKLAQYFALKPGKDLASEVLERSQSFYSQLRSNLYIDKLAKSWRMYHGAFETNGGFGQEITFTGEQGELAHIPVNHYRNLGQHILTMITANRPDMQARAVNTDVKSIAQTYLANQILEYYMKEKDIEVALRRATEMAVVFGSGFVKLAWNATGGEIYSSNPENPEEIEYEGEIEVSTLSPYDVVVDGTKETWNHDWVLTRNYVNKYILMAKYPELADKIFNTPSKSESSDIKLAIYTNDKTDDIAVYEFYHKINEAVPEGRFVQFVSPDCVLIDQGLPYHEIPIYRISAGDVIGTPYGYSPLFDIIPVQEAMNSTMSTVLTNQNAFGVQNVFVPRGADISFSSLHGGLNIVEGLVKPEPLNLTNTPAEVFKFYELLVSTAETLSGVNSVARGNPEASIKSGTAMALVQSMALQYISGLQQSYVKLIEDVGTGLINMLKQFVRTPKTVALIGKQKRPLLKEFIGEDISSINRVMVDVGNPLSKTAAGRVQMAEQMIQMQVITDPAQYFDVINTGRIDVMFEDKTSELIYIREENEEMMVGGAVQAAVTDKHSQHIQHHKSVLNSVEARRNPELLQNVLNHINEHITFLRTADPGLLQMIGEQPMAPNPMEQPPQQNVPKGAIDQSQMAEMMGQPQDIQPANQVPIEGPNAQMANLPNLPKVDANLLPNPELQAQALGNVK